MTREEFLYQFDVLYNNITSNQAPGLNGYEKSVFLTKGEIEVLKNYFNPKSNKLQEGVGESPKRHIDFSTLIVTESPIVTQTIKLSFDKMLAILNETIEEDDKEKVVIPITYKEYQRILSKPYHYPLKNQIWRLITGSTSESIKFISHGGILSNYNLTYVKYPNPILVGDINDFVISEEDVLTVEGYPKRKSDNSGWENFPEINAPVELHEEILQRAVELAKIAWQGDLNSTIVGGQRSE